MGMVFGKISVDVIDTLGNPKNTIPEKEGGMTASVTTKSEENSSKKIAMMAPVVIKEGGDGEQKMVTMQFLLPEKYMKAEEAPKPVDERRQSSPEKEKAKETKKLNKALDSSEAKLVGGDEDEDDRDKIVRGDEEIDRNKIVGLS